MGGWLCFRLQDDEGDYQSLVYSADDINELGLADSKSQEHNTTVSWVTMDSSHVEQVIDIVSRACVDHEPLMYTKKVDYDNFRKYTTKLVRAAADAKLSTVGLLGDIVVSVVISEDFKQIGSGVFGRSIWTNKPELPKEVSKGLRAIFAFLEELNQQFLSGKGVDAEKIPKREFFHIALSAVREGYGKRGLCSINIEENLEVARARGYKEAIQTATGLYAQKILSRLGFQTIFEIQYKDWMYEESRPFAEVEETTGHPSVKLMSLDL